MPDGRPPAVLCLHALAGHRQEGGRRSGEQLGQCRRARASLGELMRELDIIQGHYRDTMPIDLIAEGGSSSGSGRRGGAGVPKKCGKCGALKKGHKCTKQ